MIEHYISSNFVSCAESNELHIIYVVWTSGVITQSAN